MALKKAKKIKKINEGAKFCSFCLKDGTDKRPLAIHARRKKIKTGVIKIDWTCRKCNTERAKKYRATENGKKVFYKAVYRSIKKHQGKQNARYLLNRMVKEGKIERPKICSCCAKRKRVEGHHEDYTKPLIVVWVCRQCHFDIHKKEDRVVGIIN